MCPHSVFFFAEMEITNKRQCSQQALGCNVSTAGDPKSRERRAIGQGGTGSPRCAKYNGG